MAGTPLPETSFVGQNYSRYMDPAFDALIDRFYVTIPRDERMGILRQIVRQMTEGVHLLGLFYDGSPALIGSGLSESRHGNRDGMPTSGTSDDPTPDHAGSPPR